MKDFNEADELFDEQEPETQSLVPDISTMSIDDIIKMGGALECSHDQIMALIYPRTSKTEVMRIALALRTPNSPEYILYHSGRNEADFKLRLQLQALAGKDKDIYKAFTEEQARHAINETLHEKFGL